MENREQRQHRLRCREAPFDAVDQRIARIVTLELLDLQRFALPLVTAPALEVAERELVEQRALRIDGVLDDIRRLPRRPEFFAQAGDVAQARVTERREGHGGAAAGQRRDSQGGIAERERKDRI